MNDNAFDALSHEPRRELLLRLLEENPQSTGVVTSAGGPEGPGGPGQHPQTAMHHQHLPKLEDYEFIRWDRNAGKVLKGPRFEELSPLLECMRAHAEPTAQRGEETTASVGEESPGER